MPVRSPPPAAGCACQLRRTSSPNHSRISLATTRSAVAPEVPTVAEAGFKGLEQEVLYVAMVPAATPDAAVQTLAKAMTDALAQPDIRQRLIDLDLQAEGLTGAAATQRLTALAQHYERVIRATGMHVE